MKKLIFSGQTFDIIGDSVDKLVIRGLTHIKTKGERISARGLTGLQAYNINYILKKYLSSVVFARSIDVITGLPYDMGFFSFVTELAYKDLKKRGLKKLN